jgi:hypothetical protein
MIWAPNYKLLQMLFYIAHIFSIYGFLVHLFYNLKLKIKRLNNENQRLY